MSAARTSSASGPLRAVRTRLLGGGSGRFGAIWLATIALFACSPLLASGSLSSDAINGMLPFAAVLAIAAVGQTLVVQQGGLDLSVPGTISLAAVIITKVPNLDGGQVPVALLLVALAAIAVGAINGLAVTHFGVSPIVATLAVNSLTLGAVQRISSGSPTGAADNLNRFSLEKTTGVPNSLLIAVLLIALVAVVVRATVLGRRLEAVGDNPRAARAAGISVFSYQLSTYIAASLCYAGAGVLLAGYVKTPGIFAGNSYLLPSVAAVVLGGTSLAGGVGSVVASAVGALFLTQLDQVVLARGAGGASQLLIQGGIIALGMGLRSVPWSRLAGAAGDPGRRAIPHPAPGKPAQAEPVRSPGASTQPTVLRLEGIGKSFPGVKALHDVTFEVRPGEVHALVGENGAGKSTLMAIAAGALRPDEGTVTIAGTELEHSSPVAATALGLAVVYQTPALVPDLTVAENMAFPMPPARRPRLAQAVRWSRERLKVVSSDIDPRRRVDALTVEERHLVEISKALALEPKVLILDEPTEPLLADEIEELFARVRDATANGTAVVYISHRIPEVQRIADRLTVLRDGRVRGTYDVGDVTEDDILRLIVGRPVESVFPTKGSPASNATPALELRGLSGGSAFHGIDLRVGAGEIVGLAGVTGNGQLELMRALAGLHPSTGDVLIDGREISLRSARATTRAGISYMPGDRQREALFPSLSVRENMAILSLPDHARAGVLSRAKETSAVHHEATALAVRAPHLERAVTSLSGGNQQKVVLGRVLLASPRVLLAEEPTQGVDVGARAEIYRILRRSADDGAAVLVLSSDAIELEGLCDRVLVLSRGEVVGTLEGTSLSEESITQAALMSTSMRRRAQRRPTAGSALQRFARSDFAPGVVVLLALAALTAVTTSSNSLFLSERNLTGMLTLMTALAFIGMGQAVAMMLGGIDLSVGPLAGFLVVVGSFYINDGQTDGVILLGFLAMLGCAIAVGLVNGVLIRGVRMSPVIATLVTFIVLQGLSLLLRPQPGGSINFEVVNTINTTVGFVPVAFLLAIALGIVLDYGLRRARWGLELRSVGSREDVAHALGARVTRTHLAAYVGCSVLTFLGAIMLMAQIEIGDPSAGSTYTLSSITAVVLGGTSVLGGRGSFVGVLCGAALIQALLSSTTFLSLDSAWQYWLVGGLTLLAVATYSTLRRASGDAGGR